MTLVAGLAIAAAIIAIAVCARQRLRARELQSRLDATTQELQRVQQSCALLAPSGVIQRVVSEGLGEISERKVVTVMFTDLVGYSTLAEKLDPQVVMRVLNGYFQRVSDAVTEHRGRIGTYLGDGILSYFGALEPNPWQCNDAVAAALALRSAMEAYSRELQAEGLPAITLGAGIHRGETFAGLVGSRDRKEYAVIGHTVNLAARVQALTRTHGTDILVTDAVREQLDPRLELRAMPATPVKGIAEPVVTYGVIGTRQSSAA